MPDDGSGGFQVHPDDLATHANKVRAVASQLGQALSAAGQVTMGVQAYGMICGPLFVPMVLAVSAPGLVTLGLAQQAMNSVADGVTQTAASYQKVDQTHSTTFRTISGNLP
jgi:excreted virulence factor EspC (type VII ESX diderm)